MATFVRRNGGWKAIIRDNVGAYVKSKTFRTKENAERWARGEDDKREKATATGDAAHAHTFGELLALYRREQPVRARERKSELAWWEATLGADTVLSELRSDAIRVALRAYMAKPATRKMRDGKVRQLDREKSGATANRRLSYGSALWKLGADHGLCLSGPEHNPFRGAPRYPEPEERTRVLSAEEFKALLDAARASEWSRFYLRVLLAATCGGRPGEVERLRWCDLDLARRMAVVPKDPETGRRSKTKVQRQLFLTEPVVAELERVREAGEPDDALIFGRHTAPGRKGPADKPLEYRKHWNAALDKAGIPRTGEDKVTPYNLRHSYATVVGETLLAGVEESAAQLALSKLLGHASLQTTRRYFHPRPDVLRKVQDAALGALAGPAAQPKLPAAEEPTPENGAGSR